MAKKIYVFFIVLSFFSTNTTNSSENNYSSLSEFELMLSGFDTCDIRNVYFDEINKVASNKYFLTRRLNPIHIEQDYVIYDINENFHGIPVRKIMIPNQYPVHALYFDFSVEKASSVLSNKLKNGFHSLGDEHYFDKPVLMVDSESESKSVLTCGPKN
jgi:hypothetical protein